MSSPSTIMLTVQNTTAIQQPVSVFNPLPSQASNGSGSGNSVQNSYTYDVNNDIVAAITNNFQYISVIYSINGGVYQLKTINYGTVISSAQILVNALNSLGQATFYVSGTNKISSYSIATNGNSYYYSAISINSNYTTNTFVGNSYWGTLGSVIYNTGYSTNGVGTVNRISTGNTFWINSIPNATSGAFNRSGVLSAYDDAFLLNSLCIFTNIYLSSVKTVYLGIAFGDSAAFGCSIYLNNKIILSLDNTAVSSSLNSQLGTSSTSAFNDFWNIYPITLQIGNNYILIQNGLNSYGGTSMAFEVYDNTASQIAAATSYAGLNLLFSSKDYTQNMV